MADVNLSRPASGQQLVIPSAPDARLILDFPADQVSIDRPEGSGSLFFQFDDGASIELQNFYGAYNKEALPEFEVDGQLIAGTDFFEAFGPDLVPAAGPATAERGARYNEYSDMYSDMGLAEGVWHLNELDYRLAFDGPQADDEWTYGVLDNVAPTFSTGGAPITLGLTETGWDGKSTIAPGPVRATGSFTVRDPDGDSLTATVTIGGKTVAVSLAGPTTVESDYGTLVITPSGRGSDVTFDFEYTLKEDPYSKTDRLAQGEQVTDGIVISVNDGMGHTVTQPINVVITGSNDAPDIEGVDDFVLKDQGVWAGGERSTTLNSNENNPITKAGTDVGQFKLADGGKIVAVDPDHGDKLTYDFVSMTIGGKTTIFDSTHAVSGELPNGFTKGYVVEDYGKLYVNSETGDYRFELNTATGDSVDRLAEDEAVTISFTPSVTDMHGALSLQDGAPGIMRDGTPTPGGGAVDITIIGSNERPTVLSDATWSGSDTLVEKGVGVSGTASISGTFVATDVDNGDTLHYRLVGTNNDLHETLYLVKDTVTGGIKLVSTPGSNGDADYYGKVNIDQNGKYTVELFNDSEAVQELRGDGTTDKTFTFTVAAQDSKGAYVAQNVTGNIEGTNDAPKIVWGSIHLREEGVWNNGLWNNSNDKTVSDGKNNDGFTDDKYHRTEVTGQLIASDVDNDKNELRYSIDVTSGSGLKEKFPFEFKSNVTGEKLTISILGTEDSETQQIIKTNYGDLVLDKVSGKFTFTLGGDANALSKGESFQFHFTTVVSDGNATNNHQLAITIEGANDKPTLTFVGGPGVDSGDLKVTEAGFGVGHKAVSGNVQGYDPDSDASLSFGLAKGHKTDVSGRNVAFGDAAKEGLGAGVTSLVGEYGKLTIDSNGKYTYEIDENKANFLDTGDTRTEEFTIYVRDQYGAWDAKPITVTVMGTNDAPTIEITNVTVKEAGVYTVGGEPNQNAINNGTYTLNSNENKDITGDGVDAGQARGTSVGGKVVISDVDHDDNEHLAWGFEAVDGKLLEVSGKSTTLGEDGGESVTVFVRGDGTLTATEPADNNYYGSLTIDATGDYTFTLNNAENSPADKLGEGASKDITILLYANDSGEGENHADVGKNITITIRGSNDAPTVNTTDSVLSVTATEDAAAGGGNIASSDRDTTDTRFYGFVLDAPTGDTPTAQNDSPNDEHVYQTLYVKVGDNGPVLVSTPPDGSNDGYYGKVVMDSDGAYTFTLYNDSKDVQSLSADDARSLKITAVVIDNHGAYDHATVTLNIQGANDAIKVEGKGAQVVQTWEKGMVQDSAFTLPNTEYNGGTAEGQFSITQVDAGKNSLQYGFKVTTVTTVDGKEVSVVTYHAGSYTNEYGTFTIGADGKYTFVLDNTATATQNLEAGQTVKLGNVELAAWDTRHGTPGADGVLPPATQKLEVYINGTNDKPTLNIDTQPTYTEDGVTAEGKAITGTLSVSDPEQTGGETVAGKDSGTHGEFTFSLVGSAAATEGDSTIMVGTYGWMQINEKTGEYTYTRTSDLDYLNSGQSVKETFYVRVMDANGTHSDIKPLVVTLTGQNDAASGMDGTGLTVHEHGVTGDAAAATGYLKFDKDTFLGANKLTGGKGTDEVKVTDVDNTDYGHFKVNGTAEDVKIVASEGLTVVGTAEVDGNVITTEYGTFTLQADGQYTFDPKDNATMNVLKPGQSITITVPIQAESAANAHGKSGVDGAYTGTDTATGTITITIQGTNDAPVVEAATNGKLYQSFESDLSATLHETNTFTVDNTGTSLKLTDSETATWRNGTSTGLTVRGNLNDTHLVTDVDNTSDELSFFGVKDDGSGDLTQNIQGKYGMLMLLPNGEYQYVLDRNSDAYKKLDGGFLGKDKTDTETFTIYVRDTDNAVAEKPLELVINVTGGTPTLGDGSFLPMHVKSDKGFVVEDTTFFAKGNVQSNILSGSQDSDLRITGYNGDASKHGSTVNTEYGTISLLPDGRYTYVLNNDAKCVQELGEGQTITETFTVKSGALFGNTAVITITITGTNDKPVVIDQGDTLTQHQSNTDANGDGKLDWTGTVTDTFTVRDIDKGEAAGLKIEAVSGGKDVSGNGPWIIKGTYGQYEITRGDVKNGTDATFSYSYTLYSTSKDYNGSYDDNVTFAISDGKGGTVNKTLTTHLTADNAAPTVDSTVTLAGTVTEDAFAGKTQVEVGGSVKGAFTDTDIKLGSDLSGAAGKGDTLTFSINGTSSMAKGTYGTLFLNADGSYRYVLDNNNPAVQALGKDAEAHDTFTVKAFDGTTHSDGATLTITVVGTNDAPELTVGKVLTITEDTTAAVTGQANVYDRDADDSHTFFIKTGIDDSGKPVGSSSITNQYGTFTVDSNGKYSFEIDNSLAVVKALKAGELVETKATLVVDDGNGGTAEQEITVNIKGTASAPEVIAVTGDKNPDLPSDDKDYGYDINAVSNVGQGHIYEARGQIIAKDYEAGKAPVFTVKTQGAYGELTINENGNYIYKADAAKVEALYDGEKVQDEVTILLTAANGLTIEKKLVIDILGANDAPVPLPAADTPEWGGTLAWDQDGDSLTFTHDTQSATGIHDLTFGKLVVDADGAYRYTLNMDEATMEHLSRQPLVNGSIHEKPFAFTVDDHAKEGIPVEGSLNIKIDVDNWDGHDGMLLFGDAGSNTLDGGSGNDILSGGGGDDTLYGNGGDDYLFGGAGDDYLFGGAGDDYLFGGSGNDFLDGGEGNNHLYGGDGNDVLVFHQGDTIDGGADFDMLVVKGGSVDGLFTGAEHAKGVDSITGVEVMVSTSGDALNNLTDMAEIASKTGVSISTGSDGSTAVSFDASHTWTTTMQTASNGTLWEVYSTTITTDSGNDETVQVAVQHLTTSLGG
ncbi:MULTISPECIES: VCBS domain-containing protein [unclassified Desulfovibrio]|uniref:VCBS domain-containing protein n=1 Tax=unclassified Desulfovibrio TaxID=2593640 RepID=UPI002FDB8296